MAKDSRRGSDLYKTLRQRGVRKRVAKPVADLDGNSRRAGTKGEELALATAEDLTAAADDIRRRVLRTDPKRRQAGRKAAQTRSRSARKRTVSAKKAARTRKKVARARSGPKARSTRR